MEEQARHYLVLFSLLLPLPLPLATWKQPALVNPRYQPLCELPAAMSATQPSHNTAAWGLLISVGSDSSSEMGLADPELASRQKAALKSLTGEASLGRAGPEVRRSLRLH